ncbi:MAG: hypothetical protein ACKVVO_18320 [Opitutaceae bacterium]
MKNNCEHVSNHVFPAGSQRHRNTSRALNNHRNRVTEHEREKTRADREPKPGVGRHHDALGGGTVKWFPRHKQGERQHQGEDCREPNPTGSGTDLGQWRNS